LSTLLSLVAVVVDGLALVAVALVALEPELDYLLRLARITP
jgi:hypothetical protein